MLAAPCPEQPLSPQLSILLRNWITTTLRDASIPVVPVISSSSWVTCKSLEKLYLTSSVAASRRLTSTRKDSSMALSMPPKTHRWWKGQARPFAASFADDTTLSSICTMCPTSDLFLMGSHPVNAEVPVHIKPVRQC